MLSNALKFTQRGEVGLRVFAAGSDSVSFAVRDTGVGIAAHQQEVIFEAFRQADGSIHRKFGGTGLGLSISRDLARLLGGSIAVDSSSGAGSTFTLTLPRKFSPAAAAAPQPSAAATADRIPRSDEILSAHPAPERAASETRQLATGAIADDRDRLTPGKRLILVVEDDVPFAEILRDLVARNGLSVLWWCTPRRTAWPPRRGFTQAQSCSDINLPDFSGLRVLDQLKRDSRTRHVPVHVVSAFDYRREALELGAVGLCVEARQPPRS